MDRKMIIAILLVVIVISAGLIVVLNNNDGNEISGPVTVMDAEGRNVTTAEMPARIVSCSPSLTEIVYELGLGDRLVGVTDYCNWPEDVDMRKTNGSLASIGGYWTPSIEAIVNAAPDIVLVDQGVQAQLDMLPQMEALELNAIVLYKGLTFEEVYDNIELIGDICWENEVAEQVTDAMQDRLEEIQDAIGDVEEEPTLAFCVSLDPIYLSGNDTFVHEMITLAGGENSFSDLTSWPEVSIESMLERDPDYLFITGMMMETSGEAVLQKLRNDTLWSETSAVQNNRVYVFVNQGENIFNRPGPRMIDGVELMAMIIHENVFNVTVPNVLSDDYVDWVTGSGTYADSPISMTDSLGRSVPAMTEDTIIVSCAPSLTELVYSLGFGDNLVGVSNNCNYPTDVNDRLSNGTLSTVGSYNKPNVEAIANLTPGIVILDGGVNGHLSILPQLDDMEIKYLVLYESKTVSLIYNNVELMGSLFGKQSLARENIDMMADTIASVGEVISGRSGNVDVMFTAYFSTTSVYAVGDDTFINSIIELAGGENVFSDITGYKAVSAESVLAADPDVLVITGGDGKVNYTGAMEWLTNDPVWKEVSAVKNDQVYIVTFEANNIYCRPSVRVADGVNLLAALLYPELFGIDPLPSVISSEYPTYI